MDTEHTILGLSGASDHATPCVTCIEQAEEVRVVGWDHRNVSQEPECPDCGRPWNNTTIAHTNAEAYETQDALAGPAEAPPDA